jgi:transcriptional regulator with XRE-family HTH domain
MRRGGAGQAFLGLHDHDFGINMPITGGNRYNSSEMMAHTTRPLSPYAAEAARLLGARIRLARRERGWSQEELAERAGLTARTIYKVERGDTTVRLGAAFESAALLGVPLFEPDISRLSLDLDRIQARDALLSRPLGKRRLTDVDDDF